MREKTARATEKAVQRCIDAACGATFGLRERIYVCPRCGGTLEIEAHPQALRNATGDPASLRKRWAARAASHDPIDGSGVWRYREMLPFDEPIPFVTLFEGNTPLYHGPRSARYCALDDLRLKHQGCNPTGSFKDTGMSAAITQAVVLGAKTAVCASTGNTSASLAAYAGRAGLQAAVLLPRGQISAGKLAQSLDYGALVCEIDGNFDDCMRLIQELGDDPSIYVANSINPFRIEGQKTVAFELMEQCLWQVPDHIVVPGGNMGNSSALGKGFQELLDLGLINRLPKLSVIQAEGAAPVARLFATLDIQQAEGGDNLPAAMAPVENPRTLATAIKIGAPVSWKKALRAVLRSGGEVIAVTEQEIADAKAMIGRDGIGCEPGSATTVAGIKKLVAAGKIRADENVIAVLTGHMLKDTDYVSHYHHGTLAIDTGAPDGSSSKPIHGAFANTPARVAANKSAILSAMEKRR
ncbi:MAG TPA: threonine synthase [Candidatus Acidoferrales bacterium]|nr:threonine synthase [Candidatus Acidoferrales bacterium]